MVAKAKSAEVPEMLEYLDKTIVELEAMLDVLESRLVVVMREATPDVSDMKEGRSYSCEISRMLADKNAKIIKLGKRIKSLESRLEI